ncbi:MULTISPECIES: hypothetical protein [Salipiger]|uniref:hypothetical protein n=1 Tax=Salipiger TaxID=263377 RepID=UPI000976DD2A|nr:MULTISPECIES: hypothetical protein [Salipiger]GGA21530.1 hypothetical protein GCM10011326_37660 [Salipiger profundus]
MTKLLSTAALMLALASCAAGVSTGRKSPCAGTFRTEGSYAVIPATATRGAVVSRSAASPSQMSFAAEGSDDCQFSPL